MTPYRALKTLALTLILVVLLAGGSALALKGSPDSPESHDSNWQWLHGREYVADRASCEECHDDIDCKTCHLADYPHPDDWQDLHGTEALGRDGRGCTLCHRSGFCDPCHGGLRMPHDDVFVRDHTTGTDRAVCARCHAEADCVACHQEHGAHRAGGLVLP